MNRRRDDTPVVVLGSAGRRLYLVDWFKAAFDRLGVDGRVIVAENDTTSAAYGAGDGSWHLPRYDHPDYEPELLRLTEEFKPLAYVSLNDYELFKFSEGLDEKLRARGVIVSGVNQAWMTVAADKLLMFERLRSLGIPTPQTHLGNDHEGIVSLLQTSEKLIVKHRFGSASSGLHMVDAGDARDAIRSSAATAPVFGNLDPLEAVVVQCVAPGTEYGVDVVASLVNPGAFRGVLARKKIRMRAGETDKAITSKPDGFAPLGAKLAADAELRGLMDMDVMVDIDGSMTVIDINPRFGGGYPFVHLAGADVPLMYVAEALGRETTKHVLEYAQGVTSAKFEGVRLTSDGEGAA